MLNDLMGLPVEVDAELETPARILWSDDEWRNPDELPELTTYSVEILGQEFEYTKPVPLSLAVLPELYAELKERFDDGQ